MIREDRALIPRMSGGVSSMRGSIKKRRRTSTAARASCGVGGRGSDSGGLNTGNYRRHNQNNHRNCAGLL